MRVSHAASLAQAPRRGSVPTARIRLAGTGAVYGSGGRRPAAAAAALQWLLFRARAHERPREIRQAAPGAAAGLRPIACRDRPGDQHREVTGDCARTPLTPPRCASPLGSPIRERPLRAAERQALFAADQLERGTLARSSFPAAGQNIEITPCFRLTRAPDHTASRSTGPSEAVARRFDGSVPSAFDCDGTCGLHADTSSAGMIHWPVRMGSLFLPGGDHQPFAAVVAARS